jgi:hypothetical protein
MEADCNDDARSFLFTAMQQWVDERAARRGVERQDIHELPWWLLIDEVVTEFQETQRAHFLADW